MSVLRVYDHEQREIWRTIPGFAGLYEVSDLGRVRSLLARGGRGRRLGPPIMKATFVAGTGYLSVTLQKGINRSQAYPVHVLVALAFLGPRPSGQQVAHADGDKANAALSNLRYATPIENAQDKVAHGTAPVGTRNARHKLNEADVQAIRLRLQSGDLQKFVAADFGISQQLVSRIGRGECWTHVPNGAVAS